MQAQDLALDRADRDPRVGGQPADAARPGAGGDDDLLGRDALAAGEPHAGARDRRSIVDRGAPRRRRGARPRRACTRCGERRRQPPRVDRVVVGDLERRAAAPARAPARAGAPRSGAARLTASPRLLAHRELALERLRLVAVAGDQQRPALEVAGVDARRVRELVRRTRGTPRRSPARAASSGRSPGSASVTGASIPAATREVPRPGSSRSSTTTRSPRCAARHATARPITPPPTTATSNDLLGLRKQRPSAGITRVRFRRSADPCPPSQPALRAPVHCNASATLLARLEAGARPSPASREAPPVPGLRRRAGRVPRGRAARRRRHRAAADEGRGRRARARRRRAGSRRLCAEHGALFILNDRPDLVARPAPTASTSGQDDMPVARARERSSARTGSSASRRTPRRRSTRAAGRRLHRRRAGARDADQAGTAGGRARAGALRRRARAGARSSRSAASMPATSRRSRAAGRERVAVVRALTEPAIPSAPRASCAPRSRPGGARWVNVAASAAGARSRASPRASAARQRPPSAHAAQPRPSRAAAEQRNAAVRAALTPLAPGERPWPIMVGACSRR